jgi:hypothetical protein
MAQQMPNYEASWALYRSFLRRAFAFFFLAFIGAPSVAALIGRFLGHEGEVFAFLAIPSFLIASYYNLRMSWFPCPRCRCLLEVRWGLNLGAFTNKCPHCGLKRFSTH